MVLESDAEYMALIEDAHRRRVNFDEDFGFDRSHEVLVLNRVLAARLGEEAEPWSHWHAAEEVGMCTDCDAAGAVALVDLEA